MSESADYDFGNVMTKFIVTVNNRTDSICFFLLEQIIKLSNLARLLTHRMHYKSRKLAN